MSTEPKENPELPGYSDQALLDEACKHLGCAMPSYVLRICAEALPDSKLVRQLAPDGSPVVVLLSGNARLEISIDPRYEAPEKT